MTMKTKKALVWYGTFIVALVLNQTRAFADDITVKVVVLVLWIILGAVTYMYFKESEWDQLKKALIDKIINDQQETMYQVYYIQSDGSHDFLPEIRFTKKMAKEHFETFENIEDAINMIFKYGYVLAEFNDCTGE